MFLCKQPVPAQRCSWPPAGKECWRGEVEGKELQMFQFVAHGELREEDGTGKHFQNLKIVVYGNIEPWYLSLSGSRRPVKKKACHGISPILGQLPKPYFSLIWDKHCYFTDIRQNEVIFITCNWYIKKYQIGLQKLYYIQWFTCNRFSVSLVPFPSA